jgi:hypothetical protein
MALSITCSRISQDAQGRIHVTFSDGVELEFPSRAAALDWGRSVDTAGAEMTLRQLLMSWWLKGDPNGTTPATVIGKTITANLALANIVTVG